MNGDSKPSFSKTWWILFSVSILAIALITVALIDSKDLPITIIGAVLGVVMTVFASFILLKGQSEQQAELADKQSKLQTELQLKLTETQNEIEQKGQKDSAIFKERLNSYNQFLDALCKYVETRDEASKSILKFRTAALAMHCDNQQMIETNQAVGDIIKMYQSADVNDEELLKSLFNISDYFRAELYPDKESDRTEEYRASIKKLTERFEDGTDATDPEDEKNDTLTQEEAIEQESQTVGGWNDYIQSLTRQGWTIGIANDQINLSNGEASASIRIRKPRKGTFYVVEVISNDNDADFTKGLKAQFKGARSGGSWWRELTSLPNYGIRSGQLTNSLESNAKARTVIIKWIDKLTNFIHK